VKTRPDWALAGRVQNASASRMSNKNQNMLHRRAMSLVEGLQESWISQDLLEDRWEPTKVDSGLVDRLNDSLSSSPLEIDDDDIMNSLGTSVRSKDVSNETWLSTCVVRVRDQIRPQGDCPNDDSADQRLLNVITSLPFVGVGLHMRRTLSSKEGKAYANSMLMVGAAATLYHATHGRLRKMCRKLDYYSISYASGRMVRAIWPESKVLNRVVRGGWLLIPFRPFILSTSYAIAMQLEFIKQGVNDKRLRRHLIGHGATAVAGACAFSFEEVLADAWGFKHMHSLWHCLSAYGVYTVGKLIEHKEFKTYIGSPPSRVHDSALSLVDMSGSPKSVN
jgi:hypothetical protein